METKFDAILAQLTRNDPTLIELNLYRNQIGDAGAQALATALA